MLLPIWTNQSEASKACREFIKCTCKVNCGLKFPSKKVKLSCTELCGGGSG